MEEMNSAPAMAERDDGGNAAETVDAGVQELANMPEFNEFRAENKATEEAMIELGREVQNEMRDESLLKPFYVGSYEFRGIDENAESDNKERGAIIRLMARNLEAKNEGVDYKEWNENDKREISVLSKTLHFHDGDLGKFMMDEVKDVFSADNEYGNEFKKKNFLKTAEICNKISDDIGMVEKAHDAFLERQEKLAKTPDVQLT